MDRSRPVAIDVFCGAGGLSEGLLSAGFNVAVAIEKHPHAALTCAFNHPDTTVICDDLTKLPMSSLQDFVSQRTGDKTIDLIAGGPPCQGFSPAGLRNPNDPRNRLFEQFVRVVEHFQPRMFLFENVPGFVKLYGGKAIRAIVKRFRHLGYEMHGFPEEQAWSCEDVSLIHAADYGVPQRRKRFILIGWRADELEKDFAWPDVMHGPGTCDDLPYVGVKDGIGDLEFLSAGQESHIYLMDAATPYQEARRKYTRVLFNHLATKHRPATVQMYRRLRQGASIRSIPQEFRTGKQTMSRMSEEGCSKAVLALPDDFVHYRRHRIPTVREMARLQSFDDDYVFLGKRTTSDLNRRVDVPQYTQVGNAVPPLMAREIGKALLYSLGVRPKDMRRRKHRRQRHGWVLGSSGFSGYSLSPEAQGEIELVDNAGKHLDLPISDCEVPVSECDRVTDWAANRRRAKVAT